MGIDRDDLDRWVTNGLITREEATAIHAFEDARGRRSGGVARTILGYLGAAFVLVAGFVLVAETWGDMDRGARILVSVVAAAVLVGAGLGLARTGERAMERLGSIALLLGAAPTGLAVGLAVDAGTSEEVAVLAGFLAALAYSIVFYVRDRTWAQHVGLFGSSLGTAIALGVVIGGDTELAVAGGVTFAVGVAWLAASWADRLPPRPLAEAGAIVALGVGSLMLLGASDTGTGPGIALIATWIVVSVVLIGIGAGIDRVVLIVGGVLGLLVYLPWLVSEVVGEGAGVPIALLVAGVVLIGAAVYLTRRAARMADAQETDAAGAPPAA